MWVIGDGDSDVDGEWWMVGCEMYDGRVHDLLHKRKRKGIQVPTFRSFLCLIQHKLSQGMVRV